VALLGLGTVGTGVYSLLEGLTDTFVVTSVAVREPDRVRDVPVPATLLTSDVLDAIACADVVVEALGGLEPATSTLQVALNRGADVVTANKAVIARSLDALKLAADRSGSALRCSAAVGGSTPVLERVRFAPPSVRGLRGILNGTVNFALSEMSKGRSFEQALAEARRLGFVEQDASRDLSGRDAADKLAVIAGTLGWRLDPRSIPCEALHPDIVTSPEAPVRQVSTLWLDHARPEGRARGRVRLEVLGERDPLRDVHGVQNAANVELEQGPDALVLGKGAGRWPTAEAVVGDLLEIARDRDEKNCARARAAPDLRLDPVRT
tara:strand:- start:8097 stop:9062 length:966 start_codon:yes stop_codon:yes gene_type:complete